MEELEKIRTLLQHAEESNRDKTLLLNLIAHEIRTPLSSISMNLELIQLYGAPQLSNEMKGALQRTGSATQRLYYLVESLLCFSRSETGTLSLNPSTFSLNSLILEAIQYSQVHLKNKKIIFEPSEGSDALFQSDIHLVRLLLMNLIENVAKHSEAGEMKIEMHLSSQNRAQIRLRAPHFTLPENQSSCALGLGLKLVERIATSLKGFYLTDSLEPTGTSFTLTLPSLPLALSQASSTS